MEPDEVVRNGEPLEDNLATQDSPPDGKDGAAVKKQNLRKRTKTGCLSTYPTNFNPYHLRPQPLSPSDEIRSVCLTCLSLPKATD